MDQIRCVGLSKRFSRCGGTRFLLPWNFWRKRLASNWFLGLQGIDLTVAGCGKRLGIVGANGSGKTTLLRLIAGVTKPTRGFLQVNGHVVPLLELGGSMQLDLTGRENVLLNGILLGMRRREVRRKFSAIVEFAGVEEFLDMPLKHYSLGMIMRLGFSVAIHVDADILLVDEAWSIGDAAFQAKSFEQMRRMHTRGITTLLVSHDLEVVRQLTDEVLWLESGRVAAFGPTESVLMAYSEAAAEGQLFQTAGAVSR